MDVRHIYCWVALVSELILTRPADATSGLAQGKVAVLESSGVAFGFSGYSGGWTTISLEGTVLTRSAGAYLGYVRTNQKVYAFNSVNDHWYKSSYSGTPVAEDVEGATAIFWSSTGAYAISTLWTLWRTDSFALGEIPRGGGSASTFAAVWTNVAAHAFSAASGSWYAITLPEPAIGGLASDGLCLVWTSGHAYAFDPSPGAWTSLDLGAPGGVSGSGSGKVGMVWGGQRAQAYSQITDTWAVLDTSTPVVGGNANGEVAVLWTFNEGWAFNAASGLWSQIPLQLASEVPPDDRVSGLRMESANPTREGRLRLRLPTTASWRIELFAVDGTRVLGFDREASVDSAIEFATVGTDGRRLPAGAYWVQATSGEQIEALRIVLVD